MLEYITSLELKRFDYILNGSDVMIDILRKGQGLSESKKIESEIDDNRADITDITEEQQDEIDDIKEEAEAVDIDIDYYAEEDEDNAQVEDYQE